MHLLTSDRLKWGAAASAVGLVLLGAHLLHGALVARRNQSAPQRSTTLFPPAWPPDARSARGDSLTGEYLVGTGLYGTDLKLLPGRRFEFSSYCDVVGAPNKSHRGRYQLKGRVHTLFPDDSISADEGWERLATRLLVVTWGARKYLVPLEPSKRDYILGFCNSVNLGAEPRHYAPCGAHYLRVGDDAKPAHGAPDLPPEWKSYLLKSPVEAKIVRLISEHVAEINAGKGSGLKPGMALVDKKTRPYGSQFSVLSVEAKTARVNRDRDVGAEAIRLGEVVTTRGEVEGAVKHDATPVK
jgi:hypothetical protein